MPSGPKGPRACGFNETILLLLPFALVLRAVTGDNFCLVQAGKDRHPAASQVCHWKGHWKGALQSLFSLLCRAMSGFALKSSWLWANYVDFARLEPPSRTSVSVLAPRLCHVGPLCPRCTWCPFAFVIARCWGARIDARDQTEDPVQERICFAARKMKYCKRWQKDGKNNESFGLRLLRTIFLLKRDNVTRFGGTISLGTVERNPRSLRACQGSFSWGNWQFLCYEKCFEVPILLLFTFGNFLLSLQLFNQMRLIKLKGKFPVFRKFRRRVGQKKVARVGEAQDR